MTFRCEFLNDARLPDVQFLMKKVFGKKLSLQQVKDKYDTAYVGSKHVATLAYDGQIPIGFYGLIPQLFRLNGQDRLVGQMCDSIMVPEHQRKGIHAALAKKTFEELEKQNYICALAFHSENTYKATRKLGWKDQKNMRATYVSASSMPLGQVKDSLGLGGLNISALKSKLKDHIIDCGQHHEIDTGNFQGRVYNAETANYHCYTDNFWVEIGGCTFWLKVDRIVHVGYSHAPDEASFERAFSLLRLAVSNAGFNRILFQTHPNSPVYEWVSKLGESVESWLIGYMPFEEVDFDPVLIEYADFDTY